MSDPIAPAAPAAAPNAPRASRARASDFGVGSFKYTVWSYELSENQTQEDALNPRFWVDVVDKVIGQDKTKPQGRGQEIRCWKADTAHLFYLVIVEIGPGFIKTKLVRDGGAEAVKELPEASPLTTKWNVGKRMHDVIRKVDGHVMASNFQSKQAAADWIADHLKAMAA